MNLERTQPWLTALISTNMHKALVHTVQSRIVNSVPLCRLSFSKAGYRDLSVASTSRSPLSLNFAASQSNIKRE